MESVPPPIALRPGEHFAGINRVLHWAIVRILVQAAAVILVVIVTALITRKIIPRTQPLHHDLVMAINLLSAAALLAMYALAVRWSERRPATELNLKIGAPQFLIGIVLGPALMSAAFFILWWLGIARFAPGAGWHGLAGGFPTYFAVAVLEELLFRAVLFRILEQVAGTAIAIGASAILFGVAHGLNAGATPMGVAGVIIEGGISFALLYALTRNLWLCIGMHLGWNSAEGSLFGAQVSGYDQGASILRTSLSGPAFLTGGNFGPEGSAIVIGLFLLFAGVLGFLVVRKGEWLRRTLHFTLP
jgi:hypothetical protein